MERQEAEQIARDLNTLGDFLARRDVPALTGDALRGAYGVGRADLLVLLGGSIPHGCETAGRAFRDGIARKLMIVGGEGHTTPFLRRAIAERYPAVPAEFRTEAEIIAELLQQEFGLSKQEFLIENRSANCGENASFSFRLARESGLRPKTVIVMQDSTMQLRTQAAFQKEWAAWAPQLIGFAAYRARIAAKDGRPAFENGGLWGMWSMEHYISLLMGEIPRLRDAPGGYGPNGRNYIAHVDLPAEVEPAFERLRAPYGDPVRRPWEPAAGTR